MGYISMLRVRSELPGFPSNPFTISLPLIKKEERADVIAAGTNSWSSNM